MGSELLSWAVSLPFTPKSLLGGELVQKKVKEVVGAVFPHSFTLRLPYVGKKVNPLLRAYST
jgi:hypothetical protein